MTRRYPLEALEWLRRHRVETATARVRNAVDQRSQAETRAQAVRQERDLLEKRQQEARTRETGRLNAGSARAADLRYAEASAKRADAEIARRREIEKREEEGVALTKMAEAKARQEAARRISESLALQRHHDGWDSNQRRGREEREAEAAAEGRPRTVRGRS